MNRTINKTIYGKPGMKFVNLQLDIPNKGTHTFTLKIILKPIPQSGYTKVPLSAATKKAMFGGHHKTKRRRKPRRRRKTKRRRKKRQRVQ